MNKAVGEAPIRARLLMCPPDWYALKYEINPWMRMDNPPNLATATEQWNYLYTTLSQLPGVTVELVEQRPDAPDMVFTANAAIVSGSLALLSRFRHSERQAEVPAFKAWFEQHGFETEEPPRGVYFEGEGDALFVGDTVVAGYLKRSDIAGHTWLGERLGVKVLSVELTDSRWYHLDTAFFSLSPTSIVYYPGAFDTYARDVLRANFTVIEVDEDEALRFACNTVRVGSTLVMPSGCPKLSAALRNLGFEVVSVEMREFLKSGGAAKCLTLHLCTPAAAHSGV